MGPLRLECCCSQRIATDRIAPERTPGMARTAHASAPRGPRCVAAGFLCENHNTMTPLSRPLRVPVLLLLVAAALFVVIATLPSQASAVEPFRGSVQPIPQHMKDRMTSWRRGCPVGRDQLRLLRVSYRRFDGSVTRGNIIVHRRNSWKIVGVMRKLYEGNVRIHRLALPERYGSNDVRMGNANVTSAFMCRKVRGTNSWSEHSYGRALDINPIQNPWVTGSTVSPDGGRRYLDRSRYRIGMIRSGGVTVRAFRAIGWKWGGNWNGTKDYMHFSSTGG